jgi:hypothetical protein
MGNEVSETYVDVHLGGGGEGRFKKFGHKIAITHQNRGPLDFLATPNTSRKSKFQLQ